jgi:hypothetical protein
MEEDRVYLCSSCHWEKVPFRRWQKGWLLHMPSMRRGASPSREALHRAHAQKQLRCGIR